jgi:hypothetical protein
MKGCYLDNYKYNTVLYSFKITGISSIFLGILPSNKWLSSWQTLGNK